MKLNPVLIIILLFFLIQNVSLSQNLINQVSSKKTTLGLSAQFYPAGIILTANAEFLFSAKSYWQLRLGSNLANRKDFSQYNENEKGFGFGGTIGYGKLFNFRTGIIKAGINTDVWNMWINWKNNIGSIDQTQGRTYTLVLQPWLETGYIRKLGQSHFQIGLCVGFGREINIVTDGKAVGQGWMISVLPSIQYVMKEIH